MDYLLHADDAGIDRDTAQGYAVLVDPDGNELFSFPAEWTDKQIRLALSFANRAYVHGTQWGEIKKMRELRMALGVEQVSP